jgi:aryl carrier-like protein
LNQQNLESKYLRSLNSKTLCPSNNVLVKLVGLGLLARSKFSSVCCDVRSLARKSTGRYREKRAGRGGNREQLRRKRLKIAQWNVNDWKPTADLLDIEMDSYDVLLLSETWRIGHAPIENFETVATDAEQMSGRERPSGGLVMAIRAGIDFDVVITGNRFTQHVIGYTERWTL